MLFVPSSNVSTRLAELSALVDFNAPGVQFVGEHSDITDPKLALTCWARGLGQDR